VIQLLSSRNGIGLFANRRLGLDDTGVAASAGAVAVAVRVGRLGLGLHKGVAAGGLAEAHNEEGGNDKDPVDVVGDNGAVGGRVGPAKDGVEDAPGFGAGRFWAAALESCQDVEND
jgi:hypothetical protein